jgi:hypothetical protein
MQGSCKQQQWQQHSSRTGHAAVLFSLQAATAAGAAGIAVLVPASSSKGCTCPSVQFSCKYLAM